MGALAKSEVPWVKDLFIESFAKAYKISLEEAELDDFGAYRSFNDFFTRALQIDARTQPSDPLAITSPADGVVSQVGNIEADCLLQAKGHRYSLSSLAGQLGKGFENGSFCTIYLAPNDYHRVHAPFGGTLTDTLAMPGALFSVNGITEAGIEGLFCRNERLVCRFDTEFGPMLTVLVGALIVASIETDWSGPESPYRIEEHSTYNLNYERGEEIGRFLLGSTVICCFPKDTMTFNPGIETGARVLMGDTLGLLNQAG